MKVKKVLCVILVALLLSVQIPYFTFTSSAAIADEAEDYQLGVECKGKIYHTNRYYKFTLYGNDLQHFSKALQQIILDCNTFFGFATQLEKMQHFFGS